MLRTHVWSSIEGGAQALSAKCKWLALLTYYAARAPANLPLRRTPIAAGCGGT
jgi:hypothetical protein